MADEFDPRDVAAAEALDAEIEDMLAGRAVPTDDPALTWVAAAVRTDPPSSLAERVAEQRRAEQQRLWKPFRIVAAVMAYLFISHGVGNFFIGTWVAENLGEAHSPHTLNEGSLALIAAGIAVAAGVFSRRYTPVSVAVGVPLGLAFFVIGIGEVQEFPAGAALHLSQGFTAAALGWAFWRFWRYGGDPTDE